MNAEIQKTLDVFWADNSLMGIRTAGKRIYSGYFKSKETLLKALGSYQQETFYFVLNEIKDGCHAREQSEKIITAPKATTSDNDIVKRTWILIDCDPVRVAGVSATDAEKALAKAKMLETYTYLNAQGFYNPVIADSGNGYHLLYRVEIYNDDDRKVLIKTFLTALDMMFSDEHVTIDTAVFNAARITKLYGTMAQKGENTADRPHRMSRILRVPDEIKKTSIELIQKIADIVPKPTQSYGGNQFDIREFISKHGIRVKSETGYNGGTRLVLENCVFDDSHKAPDAAIFLHSNGAIGYRCLHNSCQDKNWQAVRGLYEPDAYKPRETQSRTSKPREPQELQSDEPEHERAAMLKPSEICKYTREKIVSIPSGIRELDRLIYGFNKQEMTIWSGVNSSGKSSLLSQLAIESIEHGFSVAIFSGELTDSRAINWIHLQAAGKQYNQASRLHERFYETPSDVCDKINKWLENNLWLYNNDYGTDVLKVLKILQAHVQTHKTDVIIIDNLMSLDVSKTSGDKYDKQTMIANALSRFAKSANVHIHFVCHPRKPNGFLRKDDISGTADLGNAADNVLMVHRVNSDFTTAVNDYFKQNRSKADELCGYDNVIEIMKNRDLGIQDEFIGLFYEIESKRFKNTRGESKMYGWADDPRMIPADMQAEPWFYGG